MGRPVELLAQAVAETRWQDLPAEVLDRAKLVLLDTLGVILAGSEQPELRAMRAAAASWPGRGATILARGFPAAAPATAALLNGTAGRSIELCESHRFVACQAAVQVLPAVLAAAEVCGSNGREILLALILGYEVAIRLGAGTTQRPLAHQNGQTAMLGAIAGAARLHGFDTAQTSRALRLGATFMLVPSYTNAVRGATVLNVAGGMSGHAAMLAIDLVKSGFLAQEDAIEEALGHLVADRFHAAPVVDGLGKRWEITRNAFRLRACCIPTYASLDALEICLAELRPTPEAIATVLVETYRFGAAMKDPAPCNSFAARYSLPHAAAAIILLGHAGLQAFSEEKVRDPDFAALRSRVRVVEDPALTAMAPHAKPGRVTLRLKDGREATHQVDSARGDFQRPYSDDEVRAKFRALAGTLFTAHDVAELEVLVASIEDWRTVGSLLDLIGGYHTARR